MKVGTHTIVVCLLAAFGSWGCGDDGGERVRAERIEARLSQIDERLARAEQYQERLARAEKCEELITALNKTVQALEQRLAAAEGRLTATETRQAAEPPSAAPSVAPPPPARTRLRERRASFRAVLHEYRERLRQINEQYANDPTSPERQKALSELQDWFRESRRAALRGEAPVEDRLEQEPPGGQ